MYRALGFFILQMRKSFAQLWLCRDQLGRVAFSDSRAKDEQRRAVGGPEALL